VRIYLSSEVTDRKLYTLMHDDTTYNPALPHRLLLGSGIDWSKAPVPVGARTGRRGR